jgi:cobalt-zinc-cadmium efflux system membrane fusion protein
MGGYLKYTKQRMYVTKGQVLCVVEDHSIAGRLPWQKQKLDTLNEFERQKELNRSKASSDKVYQLAQSEYNSLSVMVQSYGEIKIRGINPNKVSTKPFQKVSMCIHQ